VARARSTPTLGTSTRDEPVAKMFSDLAPEYDRMNTVITFGLAQGWRRELVRRALPVGRCLDFGCGTGDLTEAILAGDPKARLTGFDLTRTMLYGARSRLERSRLAERAALAQGDGEKLPFRTASFDTVVSSFVMRNVGDRTAAYREIARVLKPGGRFLQLELAKPENPMVREAYLFYFREGMPRLAGLFSHQHESFQYLAESIGRWPQPAEIAREIRAGGFLQVEQAHLLFGGVAIHVATR
jgi:demethylmenaquinone methyltransferase / 2-methoxy-6-polyprenyl-1,4-benzoquinol methylase